MLRVYLVDMDNLPQFDQAFKEHFGEINPACTLVGISDLVDEGLLIEIECIAEKSA